MSFYLYSSVLRSKSFNYVHHKSRHSPFVCSYTSVSLSPPCRVLFFPTPFSAWPCGRACVSARASRLTLPFVTNSRIREAKRRLRFCPFMREKGKEVASNASSFKTFTFNGRNASFSARLRGSLSRVWSIYTSSPGKAPRLFSLRYLGTFYVRRILCLWKMTVWTLLHNRINEILQVNGHKLLTVDSHSKRKVDNATNESLHVNLVNYKDKIIKKKFI